ncbi:MAG: cytidine deaminase [Clostridia bacterium]|nr:cytidine deaminase [Clostridia bacterium]
MNTSIGILIEKAQDGLKNAYAPYSYFKVGSALLCSDGEIYTGCNVENASYGGTICAERVALSKAVSDGKRDFSAICIVGGKDGKITDYCYPCGICRQFISELCRDDFKIILYNGKSTLTYTIKELFPNGFSGNNIK